MFIRSQYRLRRLSLLLLASLGVVFLILLTAISGTMLVLIGTNSI